MTNSSSTESEILATFDRLISDSMRAVKSAGLEDSCSDSPYRTLDLLDVCVKIHKLEKQLTEPVRSVHHLACTGGTLICKGLSVMPNVQLLSEVEPHSQQVPARGKKFYPTDLIALLRSSPLGSSTSLETSIFLAGMNEIYQYYTRRGCRLIVRDHAHSKYSIGSFIRKEPGVREVLKKQYTLLSFVSVRHPYDSYASLVNNGWLHFRPRSPEEYCSRYLKFLDEYQDLKVFRYEDFVADPVAVMADMCAVLELPFHSDFEHFISTIEMSGDSGRSSSNISLRSRRLLPDAMRNDFRKSSSYSELCSVLGYEDDLD